MKCSVTQDTDATLHPAKGRRPAGEGVCGYPVAHGHTLERRKRRRKTGKNGGERCEEREREGIAARGWKRDTRFVRHQLADR